jgi:hypothetical protein
MCNANTSLQQYGRLLDRDCHARAVLANDAREHDRFWWLTHALYIVNEYYTHDNRSKTQYQWLSTRLGSANCYGHGTDCCNN